MPGYENGFSVEFHWFASFYLNGIIIDGDGGSVTFANPTSSDVSVATVTLSSDGMLTINQVNPGSAKITVDITDSQGVTGKYVINARLLN